MFDPMERGRQIREERQRRGCGFCEIADNAKQTQPYQRVGDHPQVAEKLRITRRLTKSANHPKATKPTTTGLPENPQNPQGKKPADTATHDEVETILAGLAAAGRNLGTLEPLARMAMTTMNRAAAAELAVAFCDAFEVVTDDRAARAQCRRLLNDPRALAAAKAIWPELPIPSA